jgi:uncharacterized protein (DUF885 family)
MNRRHVLAALLASASPLATPVAAFAQAASASTATEDARLNAFLDRAFDERVALSPQFQTSLGLKTNYDKLNDYTPAADDRQLALARRQLADLKRDFDPAKLGPSGRISYTLFERQAEQAIENDRWRWHDFPFAANGTPTGALPVFMINNHRVDSVEDAQAYVARLRDAERAMTEIAADLEERARRGVVPPILVFEPSIADARKVITGAPFTDGPATALWTDFQGKVGKLQADEATKARLIAEGRAALTGPFRRGYDKVIASLQTVSRQANSNDGVWRLPDGAAYYANRVKNSTTTDLTPDQVHQIGLDEIARIHGEMRQIMQKVGFTGSLQAFFQHLKTGAQYHYPNTDAGREQYLADARAYIAGAMQKAPTLFHRLPKSPLEVRAVEKWREATASVAFYNRGTPDGSRPGIFYVNLSDLTQTLKPQVEAIAYHEGAPGHHFQISFAQEQASLPKFRRFGGYGAYSEGWGLYSESLGKEMGFYQDPYSDFGRLSLELWRAGRLVVDTGIHAKRWPREKAIAFFKENTLLSDLDITREIDRYITNPGQATSYKIGQLKIVELRGKAEKALGAKFDVRDFHDVVLSEGGMPLDVLEQQVDAYIASKA